MPTLDPVPENPVRGASRARVLAHLKRHGASTTSFQILEPGLEYWFDSELDACVAYADTGGAWVAAGGPVAPREHEQEAAARFVVCARARGKRPRFFAVERASLAEAGLSLLHIGEEPVWNPANWPHILAQKRSLREQLRRARAKGVIVRRPGPDEIADPASPVRRGIDALVVRWKESRAMAPMGFVVQIDLYTFPEERRFFVAEHAGAVVGVLVAVPIYARRGWFLEDALRHPEAPNGTVELLFDHAMRAAAEHGIEHVTYGLAPLCNTPSRALRLIRDHTRMLYDFVGLHAFKAKLKPDAWHPVYLAFPRRERGVRAVIDVLAAFAGKSLVRFALATLRHRAAAVTLLFALLLVPWTAAMAHADTTRWFPSTSVKATWITLDLVLCVLLMLLSASWTRVCRQNYCAARRLRCRCAPVLTYFKYAALRCSRRLALGPARYVLPTHPKPWAMALAGLALADFALGTVQAALYNIPRARGPVDGIIITLALAAPLGAAVFLWLCRNRAHLYRGPPVSSLDE